MESSPRKKKNVSSDDLPATRRSSLPIPIEITIVIFSKLDLKSIARCRCVSKLWTSILRRSDFTELFMSMSCSRGPKLLLASRQDCTLFFSSPLPQNPDINLARAVINYGMKVPFGHCNAFEHSDLVNGLLCLTDQRTVNRIWETVMIICNPSTGQTLSLPKMKTSYRVWGNLGYDPIDKQFKVLAMMTSGRHGGLCDEFQVLTLGSGIMSWKKINCCIPHNPPFEKICVNGVLYYTCVDLPRKTCKIVCFDIRSEKFTFIEVTGTLKEVVQDKNTDLINYNGKLGLLQWYEYDGFIDSVRFKLWILEDVEKQEWSDHMFLFSNLPENIDDIEILRCAGVTKRKEIVLWSKNPNYPLYLFYLNLEKKTIKRVEIQGMDTLYVTKIFIDHVEDVKFY